MKFINEGNEFIIETEKNDSTEAIRYMERQFWALCDLLSMLNNPIKREQDYNIKQEFKKQMTTKEEFEKYEKLRKSGVTNMLDIYIVKKLSGLSTDILFDIMTDYIELKKKFK